MIQSMLAEDPIQNNVMGSGFENPEHLLANPFNWRIHPEAQQQALEGALKSVGWICPVIVNLRTGHIVDGHLRVMVALRRGEHNIPVSYVDLSENQERLALATFDPICDMAVTDASELHQLLDLVDTTEPALMALLDQLATDANIVPPALDGDDEEGDGGCDACPHCGSLL